MFDRIREILSSFDRFIEKYRHRRAFNFGVATMAIISVITMFLVFAYMSPKEMSDFKDFATWGFCSNKHMSDAEKEALMGGYCKTNPAK